MKGGFTVRVAFDFNDDFSSKDDELFKLFGRESDFSGSGCGIFGCGMRDHGFEVATYKEAERMKNIICDHKPSWMVTFHESITENV